jgi:hypothetical protein
MLVDRLSVIQHFLRSIDPHWHLKEPQSDASDEDIFVLQNEDGQLAYVTLPRNRFDGSTHGYIDWEIRRAIKSAKHATTSRF